MFLFINLLPVVKDASCTLLVHCSNKLALKNMFCKFLANPLCKASPVKPSILSSTAASKANPVSYISKYSSSLKSLKVFLAPS